MIFATHTVVSLEDVALARAAGTDRAVAERVLRRLQPRIHQVVRSLVRSSVREEEIGQTVLLEVLRSLHNYRGEAPLEAWAAGVAYKVTMRLLKKQRKWERVHTPLESDEGAVHFATPETRASKQQLYDRLQGQMEIIPEKRRTPLLLHLVHGYTVSEISQTLQISPNTTKDRLKTALRELREVFDRNPSLRAAMLEEIR